MPELPEVETVVRDLRESLVGRRISAIHQSQQKLRTPWKKQWTHLIVNSRIVSLNRRGKWILMTLEGNRTVLIHLGMTGQLTLHAPCDLKADHTHLRFELEQERELRFCDIRRFGSAQVFETAQSLLTFLQSRLGSEPFDAEPEQFYLKLRKTDRYIKAVLLDQRVLAGVGNIYADESCYRARLHPKRKANRLTRKESDCLLSSVQVVLTRAIENRGSTIRNYVGGSGLEGQYQSELEVYGRSGERCRHCHMVIQREVIAGRATHYCARCQPSE